MQTEQPKQASFGEIAVPAAFQLARQLKKAPKAIAAELSDAVGRSRASPAIEIAGNGYLNVRLDRGYYGAALLARRGAGAAAPSAEKIIVEHTNINPNKAAHIGHLRNAILGDTFVRMLRAIGPQRGSAELHRQHRRAGGRRGGRLPASGEQIARRRAGADRRPRAFDYLCWDLYARISAYYADHPEALEWRSDTLHAIEAGRRRRRRRLAHLVADAIVQAHLATMWRLNIVYDVLPRESEILHLKFWATAFELRHSVLPEAFVRHAPRAR